MLQGVVEHKSSTPCSWVLLGPTQFLHCRTFGARPLLSQMGMGLSGIKTQTVGAGITSRLLDETQGAPD